MTAALAAGMLGAVLIGIVSAVVVRVRGRRPPPGDGPPATARGRFLVRLTLPDDPDAGPRGTS